MDCVIVDATILRYFGTSDQISLLRPWAPLFVPPRILLEIRQSRSPAIPRVEQALTDGLLSDGKKASDETYRTCKKPAPVNRPRLCLSTTSIHMVLPPARERCVARSVQDPRT